MSLADPLVHRMVAVALGIAVLFGTLVGLGWASYYAIPLTIAVYTACRLGFALLTPEPPAK